MKDSEICGYIIHWKGGGAERETHIKNQIKNLSIPFKFMEKEPSDTEIERDFKEGLAVRCGITSCTFKHFESYRDMIRNNFRFGLIFENDIVLNKNFEISLQKAIAEIKENSFENIFLSLEDSYFKFVPGSCRIKGKTVYKTDGRNTRCAAAYLIDLKGAQNLISEVERNKCGCVIDHFHTNCAAQKTIDIYWLHPTIAAQGSRGGFFASTFQERKLPYPRLIRILSYKLQRQYKRFLWFIR